MWMEDTVTRSYRAVMTNGKQSPVSKQRVMRAYCDVTFRQVQVLQFNESEDRGLVGSL